MMSNKSQLSTIPSSFAALLSRIALFSFLLLMGATARMGNAYGLQVPMGSPEKAPLPDPSFEAVTVHDSPDQITFANHAIENPSHSGALKITNLTLKGLIQIAYGVDGDQIEGLHSWETTRGFDINAKADDAIDAFLKNNSDDVADDFKRKMIQNLLHERFGLVTHVQSRTVSASVLSIGRGGSKLLAAGSLGMLPGEEEYFQDPHRGIAQFRSDRSGYIYRAHSCSLPRFATELRSILHRPVIDHTGLSGLYDFQLSYSDASQADENTPDQKPPLGEALSSQLGLKLTAGKGTVSVMVVDHAALPTAN